jgi:hypothetical protein
MRGLDGSPAKISTMSRAESTPDLSKLRQLLFAKTSCCEPPTLVGIPMRTHTNACGTTKLLDIGCTTLNYCSTCSLLLLSLRSCK